MGASKDEDGGQRMEDGGLRGGGSRTLRDRR